MTVTTTQEGGSIRESLEAAYDKQEAPPAQPAPVEAPPAPVAQPAEKPASAPGRDEAGRFAPKAEKTAEVQSAESKPGEGAQKPDAAPVQPAETAPPASTEKAPQSWTPAAREEWNKLPPTVRQEVQRREKEVSRALQESASARKLAQEFEQVAAPYRALFTAPPVQVAASLFQTAARLQTGSLSDRASIIAHMMRDFGVSGDAVADAYEGRHASQPTEQHSQYRDPRVDQILAQLQAQQQRTQQALSGRAQQEVETFAASGKGEFLDDVRDTMADMMELAAKRGVALSIEDAYARAVQAHPEVAKVLQQREEAKRMQTARSATASAKAAASSVRNEPAAPGTGAQPISLRGALEAAFAAHSGR